MDSKSQPFMDTYEDEGGADDFTGEEAEQVGQSLSSSVQIQQHTLDLSTIAQNYAPTVALYRLEHIADHSRTSAREALTLAETLLRDSDNIDHYEKTLQQLEIACQTDGVPLPDGVLSYPSLGVRSSKIKAELKALEEELQKSRSQYMKEKVRSICMVLGDKYFGFGHFPLARRTYLQARHYCTKPEQLLMMNKQVVVCSLSMHEWSATLASLKQYRATAGFAQSKDDVAFAHAVEALCLLMRQNFGDATRQFLAFAKLADSTEDTKVLTAADAGVYGACCALATLTREELFEKLIHNAAFMALLDGTSYITDALKAFHSADYRTCLTSFEKARNNYLLDAYLAPNFEAILKRVRVRALKQFFLPYQTVTLDSMAQAFASDVQSMEQELCDLIQSGDISGKIDSDQKLLCALNEDAREEAFAKGKAMVDKFQAASDVLLFQSAVTMSKLSIKQAHESGDDAFTAMDS